MLSKLPEGDDRLRAMNKVRARSSGARAKGESNSRTGIKKVRKNRKTQRKAKLKIAKSANALFEAGQHAEAISLLCDDKNVRVPLSRRDREEQRLGRTARELAGILMKVCGVVVLQGLFPADAMNDVLKAQDDFHTK